MLCLRAALKYRASRMAEITTWFICNLWDSTRYQVSKTERHEPIETWVLCRNNDDLFAFPPSPMIEMVIKRSADCFASEGILNVIDSHLFSCINLSDLQDPSEDSFRKYATREPFRVLPLSSFFSYTLLFLF